MKTYSCLHKLTYDGFRLEIPHLCDTMDRGDSITVNGVRLTFGKGYIDVYDFLEKLIVLVYDVVGTRTFILMTHDVGKRINCVFEQKECKMGEEKKFIDELDSGSEKVSTSYVEVLTNQYEKALKNMSVPPNSPIKDSGTRTSFSTGAVRDGQTGKGRRDLLPFRALIELSKHYEAGALKYDERNWEKGIPLHTYVSSALNHLFKFMIGCTDEPHLTAAAWNIMCLLDTVIRIKEGSLPEDLNTLPITFKEINLYWRKDVEA